MSMIEQLREETRHQAPVAPPKEPSADAESPHPSNKAARAVAPDPTHPDICRYWIAQLEAIQTLPTEQQAVRLNDALAKAPEAYRPTPDEAMVLQAASQTLSINSVLDWLHLHTELPTDVSPLSPTAAQHWRQHLPASSDSHWAARLQDVARATPQDNALPPAVLNALQDHPEWAAGYLQCSGIQGRVKENRLDQGRPAYPAQPEVSPSQPTPSETPSPPLERPRNPPPSPVAGASLHGAPVGQAIGALAGCALGAVASAVTSAAGVTQQKVRQAYRHFHSRLAEQALAEVTQATHQIRRHPALRTYWAQVEQAVQQAGGDPASLWRTLDNPTTDNARTLLASLQGHLNQALNRAPSLAADFEKVHQAFDHLNQRWEKSVTNSRKAGTPWFPSDDQVQRLKAACLDVPLHDERWLASVERLVGRLQEIYRAAMEGLRAGVSTRSPAPGP
ncbi:MAG: hypothetical protein H6971_03570 [Gammaproteobacteria bacterium]|nr:hypothetical protein [Gammaproteobacteria bacterium]